MNACPDMAFDCDGEVSSWEFYSASDFPTTVYFSVWRRDNPDDINYKLIGYNAYNSSSQGRILFSVPALDRFRVQAGDFIGVFYERPDRHGVVPFADIQAPHGFATEEFYTCSATPKFRADIVDAMSRYGRVLIGDATLQRVPFLRAYVDGNF